MVSGHSNDNACAGQPEQFGQKLRPVPSLLISCAPCSQMKRLTPNQMAMLMKTAAVGQKAYAGLMAAWQYLLARPAMLVSLVVLLVAVLLRLCGWL